MSVDEKEERDQNSWMRNNKISFLVVCSGYDPILDDALGFERQRRLNERMREGEIKEGERKVTEMNEVEEEGRNMKP